MRVRNPRSVGAKCTVDIIGVKSNDIALLTERCIYTGVGAINIAPLQSEKQMEISSEPAVVWNMRSES